MTATPQPYVYKITSSSGSYYFGSRSANTVPAQLDLWVKYFTSSKTIKEMLERGDKFTPEILSTHETGDAAYWVEQDFIKANIQDRQCLNRHFVDPMSGSKKFSTTGASLSPEPRKAVGDFHRGMILGPHSTEHRKKIAAANRGKHSGPLSEEHRKSISAGLRGGKRTPEQRERMSAAQKARPFPEHQRLSMIGRKLSEETKRKISERAIARRRTV